MTENEVLKRFGRNEASKKFLQVIFVIIPWVIRNKIQPKLKIGNVVSQTRAMTRAIRCRAYF